MTHTCPSVTITLTRYREPDWLVLETLESLALQTGVTGTVIFLDQMWSEEFACKIVALSGPAVSFAVLPCPERGLSHARNLGLEMARTDIVLFIDCDAIAAPDWAANLARALENGATIAGSRILAQWVGRKPILARSQVVLDQYSILDWGEATIEASRIVGAAFGIVKSGAPSEMYFDCDLGRRQGLLVSGEESDLCRRVLAARGKIVYCGESAVLHQILPERLNVKWIWKRLYYAGVNRRRQSGAPSPSAPPCIWDWLLLPVILPPYIAGFVSGRN